PQAQPSGFPTRPPGILLATGPTASAKPTTLYAALDKITSATKKIITIEDPVEYQLRGVNQIHVKPKIGLSFAAGLRHIVRQDPDVIMVGEIRDLETADIGIHAALTGHLVFSTLHTNDAPGALTRLLDMGAEPFLVSSVLEGVLAQRLVRIICAACRQPYEPEARELRSVGIEALPRGIALFRGKGCGDCRGTGYRGRTGIYEFLPMSEEMRSLTLRKSPGHEIRQRAIAAGMTTLRQDGWAKCCAGVTTIAHVQRVTHGAAADSTHEVVAVRARGLAAAADAGLQLRGCRSRRPDHRRRHGGARFAGSDRTPPPRGVLPGPRGDGRRPAPAGRAEPGAGPDPAGPGPG